MAKHIGVRWGRARRMRELAERGATAVEYALMVSLVAIAIIAAVSGLGGKVGASLTKSGASMSGDVVTTVAPSGCSGVHANGYSTALGDPNGNCYAPGVGYYTV